MVHCLSVLASSLLLAAHATKPSPCGEDCGHMPPMADWPHNENCFWGPGGTSKYNVIQPHYHISDSCFDENDSCGPFYFNGMYHVMYQKRTQFQHWNKSWSENCSVPGSPKCGAGDVGISAGHAVSPDLIHWEQVEAAIWPNEWFTSVSVYDFSTTVVDGVPTIIAAGLTPNSTSPFCHFAAVPTDLSDPYLKDWKFADNSPLYCGDLDHKYKPGDSPSNAWQTSFGEWRYYDAYGEVYFSKDFKSWDVADGKFPNGICQDFYELPRVCDGCSTDISSSIDDLHPTHARLGATTWQLMAYDEGSPGEAGTLQATNYASVALFSDLDVEDQTDFGTLYCPKSFVDPIKQRRLMYGWNRGGCKGMGANCKGSTQSLLREVTYDPRFGMLNFYPIQEYEELRGSVLAHLGSTQLNGDVSLQLPPFVANQSEVLLRFELPSEPVRFGVRVLTGVCQPTQKSIPWCTPGETIGNEFFVDWTPAPEMDAAAWSVLVGSNRSSTPPMGEKDQLGHVPILSTDKNFEMKIYIDRTYAEAFFAGGRLAMVTPLQGASLYRPDLLFLSNNTQQGIEIFASKPHTVTITSAKVWEMGQIWKNVTTHDLGDESFANNLFAV